MKTIGLGWNLLNIAGAVNVMWSRFQLNQNKTALGGVELTNVSSVLACLLDMYFKPFGYRATNWFDSSNIKEVTAWKLWSLTTATRVCVQHNNQNDFSIID